MATAGTEAVNSKARGLDLQPPLLTLLMLADAQVEAAAVVRDAVPAIAAAAELAANRLAAGGRLFYAAAGSSGLMALADGLELPGTFGIARDRIVILVAGGQDALSNLAGAPEDSAEDAIAELSAHKLTARDCLIAVSASGSTPYAVAALEEGRRRGAATIAIANNEGSPLLAGAEVAIALPTPPELIAGSTRMGAGTAQKIALNMLSTMIGIHLGHVHDGYMVNLFADNLKLRDRAARMVEAIAGCGRDEAAALLERAGGSVKAAILMAAGAADEAAAQEILSSTGQKIRPALERLKEGSARSRHNGT